MWSAVENYQRFGQYFISRVLLLKSERFSSLTCFYPGWEGQENASGESWEEDLAKSAHSTQYSDCDTAQYKLQFIPLCTLQLAICILHFALCILHFTLCILHFELCTMHKWTTKGEDLASGQSGEEGRLHKVGTKPNRIKLQEHEPAWTTP